MPSPREKLIDDLRSLADRHGLTWDEDLGKDLPRKWRIYNDMLLLPSSRAFVDPRWLEHIRSYGSLDILERRQR